MTWDIFGPPLHLVGEGRCHTGCVHCASCGLGPQTYLTYRYESDVTTEVCFQVQRLSNGLCPRCSAR